MALSHNIQVFSDGSLGIAPVPAGELYTLKNYNEANEPPPSDVANFTAINLYADPLGKTAGQTNWLLLAKPEIDFVKWLNIGMPRDYSKWGVQEIGEPAGRLYRALPTGESSDEWVRWIRIALASSDMAGRNQVSIIERGTLLRIESIPKSADYTRFANCPWLIHTSYNVYPDGHTGDVPQFKMPLFNPAEFPVPDAGARGLWLEPRWIYGRVS